MSSSTNGANASEIETGSPVTINPLNKSSTPDTSTHPVIAYAEEEDEEEEENNVYFSLPPLVRSTEASRSLSIESPRLIHALKIIDIISINIGSVMFIVGSFYFYPSYKKDCGDIKNCALVGTLLFILGSYFFLQGSVIAFILSGGSTYQDMPLAVNGLLYIGANTLFVIGSVFFLPSITEVITDETGVILFTLGSVIFVVAPCYNVYRALDLLKHGMITSFQCKLTIFIAVLYIVGSLAFVVGSIYFLPSIFQTFSVTLFVFGSLCFQCSALLAPLKYGWKLCSTGNVSVNTTRSSVTEPARTVELQSLVES